MHLSETQLLDYRNNALSSEELLSVSDHLTSCDFCRERSGMPLGAVMWTTDPYNGHLSYAEIAAVANDAPRQIHYKVVEEHLSECDLCALQVRDLVELRRDLGEIPPAVSSPDAGIWERIRNSLQPRFLVPVFGLLIVILLGAVWFLNQEREPQTIVEVPLDPTSVVETEIPGAVVEDPAAPTENAPEIVATIRDGRGKIEIDSGGEVTGSPAAWREKIRNALLAGDLAVAQDARELRGSQGVLMSEGTAGVPFALRRPVGRVIETARPAFTWDPVDGAIGYTVEIFDENFDRIVSSPPLSGTTWKSPASLPRGGVYLWQVAAVVDGAEVRSPTRPAPDAKFKVISSANDRAITAARRSGSRLALGIAYAEAGMLPEAEAEFAALQKQNPGSAAIRSLLRKVRARR